MYAGQHSRLHCKADSEPLDSIRLQKSKHESKVSVSMAR